MSDQKLLVVKLAVSLPSGIFQQADAVVAFRERFDAVVKDFEKKFESVAIDHEEFNPRQRKKETGTRSPGQKALAISFRFTLVGGIYEQAEAVIAFRKKIDQVAKEFESRFDDVTIHHEEVTTRQRKTRRGKVVEGGDEKATPAATVTEPQSPVLTPSVDVEVDEAKVPVAA